MKRLPFIIMCFAVTVTAVIVYGQQGGQGGGRRPRTPPRPRHGAITMPRWSPDGGLVAFVYDVGGNSEVYIADSAGRNLKNVSASPGADTDPVWRPDGQTLLYSSSRGGQFDLCLVDRRGENRHCVDIKGDDLHPAWSPDGRTIAFCNYEKGSPLVYFMNPDGSGRELFFKEKACHPAFSADGKRLALSSESDLLVFNLKNRKHKNITEPLIEGDMVSDTMPVWAPKGDRIAFIGAFEAYAAELYTISANGKKVRRITETLYEDFRPDWDPKGRGVLYSAYVAGRPPEIIVSDPESPRKTRLTDNDIVESSPRYSPDGATILYVVRGRTQDELHIMDRDGKGARAFLQEPLPTVEQAGSQRILEHKRKLALEKAARARAAKKRKPAQ